MKLTVVQRLGIEPTLKSPMQRSIPFRKIINNPSLYASTHMDQYRVSLFLIIRSSPNVRRKTPRNAENRHKILANIREKEQQSTEHEWVREYEPQDPPTAQSLATNTPLLEQDLIISNHTPTWWQSIPRRYQLVFATSLSFIICNLDKVNISVAIIPMAQDFGWSPTISGLVQSSFFYGYLLSQIPGGYASTRYGGKKILPLGVTVWSIATAAVPVLAGTVPGLCLSRAAVGLGEGVAPSAATDIVARVIDPKERSRAISFIFGGLHVGSLLGLLVAPTLIEWLGWPSVFYLFGGMGIVWSVWWSRFLMPEELSPSQGQSGTALESSEAVMVRALDEESHKGRSMRSTSGGAGVEQHSKSAVSDDDSVPWRAFIRNRAVQALAFTHFCNNWFHYTMLAWLPTYFTDTLSVSLVKAAQVSVLPPVAAIAVSAVVGPLADGAIERGMDVGTVRKLAQSAAFLGPAAGLIIACMTAEHNGAMSVACITLSLGLASFSLGGLYCNHADLSPRYAPVLLGMTNTAGAIPGIMGVAFTGWVYDSTGSWTTALFIPSIFFFLSGTAVFLLNGTSERQDFTMNGANEPFGLEKMVDSWRDRSRKR